MLLLPVSIAVDCLSSLAVMMGAARAARLLGYVKTNGDRQHVSSLRSVHIVLRTCVRTCDVVVTVFT